MDINKINLDKTIKTSIKDKSKLYDRLYEVGDFLLKKYNPCGIKNGKCIRPDSPEFCCGGCEYLIVRGCSVKSLSCKLWLCVFIDDKASVLSRQLLTLSYLQSVNDLWSARKSKEEVIRNIVGMV